MNLLDFLTLLSFIGLNVDVILQARKIRQVKSSEDISIAGLMVRFVAIFVILYKLICVGDMALILGQALLALTFTTYMFLVFSYLPKAKKKRKPRKR
jgi:uncharacterized protein with PQ loop repeat